MRIALSFLLVASVVIFGLTFMPKEFSESSDNLAAVVFQIIPDENSIVEIEKIPTQGPKASILFVGDIMLGRDIESKRDKRGGDYPFGNVTGEFDKYDLVFGNLEGPILSDHKKTPVGSMSFSFDESAAESLSKAGVDIVSLSNNHTADQGQSGLIETINFLTDQSVLPSGHPNVVSREDVTYANLNGYQIIFVSLNFTYGYGGLDDAASLVKELRGDSQEAFLVVSVHWGDEYQTKSNARQQEAARLLIDNGVDLIIGSHPHVVQEMETYKSKLIFYSLGNFIFDQYFSADTQHGLAVGIEIEGERVTVRPIPVEIVQGQPRFVNN